MGMDGEIQNNHFDFRNGSIMRPPTTEYLIQKEGIEKFVEKPCIEACKKLWDLNISTIESSGGANFGWIAISHNYLSDENKAILTNALVEGLEGYSDKISYKEYQGIVADDMGSEEEVSLKLLELASLFKMQDFKDKEVVFDSIDDYLASVCQICTYELDDRGIATLQFDPTQLKKPREEYLSENGAIYVENEGKVYLNDYYLQKHNNYLAHIAASR